MSERNEILPKNNSNGGALVPAANPSKTSKPGSSDSVIGESLVRQHFGGNFGLADKLASEGKVDIDSLMSALIDEMVGESDALLGNRLVAAKDGDIQASTVIAYKRAQVLEKAVKSAQAKQQFERETGVDLDSPSMMVVFRFFMAKTKSVFESNGMSIEQSDVFFRTLGEQMEDWKKELQEEFKVMTA